MGQSDDLKFIIADMMRRLRAREVAGAWKGFWPLARTTIGEEEILAALEVLCSGRTTMWEQVAAFEREFAARFAPGWHAVMVNSGTSADLLLALLLRERIGAGSTVLIPTVTWPTHAWAALFAGLRVRLVDVAKDRLWSSAEDYDRAHGLLTFPRAVWPVHPLGDVAPMGEIVRWARDNRCEVVEDSCDALGATLSGQPVGTFGLGGAFSLFVSHGVCAAMEGGVVVVKNEDDADRCRMWRAHGWTRNLSDPSRWLGTTDRDPRFAFVEWGLNLRPTEVQAAIARVGLRKADAVLARRAAVAEKILAAIPRERRWLTNPLAKQAWLGVPFQDYPRKKPDGGEATASADLETAGVETRPILAGSLARQPAAKRLSLEERLSWSDVGSADHVDRVGRYVGVTSEATDAEVGRACAVLAGALK